MYTFLQKYKLLLVNQINKEFLLTFYTDNKQKKWTLKYQEN